MSDYKRDYWRESVDIALDECGATGLLSDDQIESIAGSMESSAENRGTAFGHDAIANPLSAEVRAAEQRLREQRSDSERSEGELRELIESLRCRIGDLEYKLSQANSNQ